MKNRSRQLAIAVSVALGTAIVGIQADTVFTPDNGVVITNIGAQPNFDKHVCYSPTGATGGAIGPEPKIGELGNCEVNGHGGPGPRGATGPTGPTGPTGQAGAQGLMKYTSTTSDVGCASPCRFGRTVEVDCPNPKIATGGGFEMTPNSGLGATGGGAQITRSAPGFAENPPISWIVSVAGAAQNDYTLRAWVICIDPVPLP